MTAPKRIWAFYSEIFGPMWIDKVDEGRTEYVRADLHDATKAQLAKTVEALRFYADSHEIPSEGPWGLHSNDFGSKARAVLAEIEKGEPK